MVMLMTTTKMSMSADNYNVTGIYLRGFLAGLRKISGKTYSQLLEQAGLGQFQTKYPPADIQVVAKGSQLINLFTVVRQFLGEDGYNLFMRNLGREMAQHTTPFPMFKTLATNITRQTPQDEFREWLELLVLTVNQTINHQVSVAKGDQPNQLKISYPQCIYCTGQGIFTRPSCPLVPTFYRQLISNLTSISCQLEETHCGAMYVGEDTCHYLLERL
jgi:predicted hydrocarbon binding protein